jgi:hypothetical protein
MKTIFNGRLLAVCAVILALASFTLIFRSALFARGMSKGVGCWMEGTVTNINVNGDSIHLQLTGRFWLKQHRLFGRRLISTIEVDCSRGLSANLTQNEFFVAETPDGTGGAVRNDKGALTAILKAAAERGRTVKLELVAPVIAFDRHGGVTNVDVAVVRATDADLH